MKNKKMLILAGILIGVISCFGFNKVQASEITSAFENKTLTRNNISLLTASNSMQSKVLGIIKERANKEYYEWNVDTTGSGKKVWKIASYSSEISPDYSDLIYCLNATRGFENSNGNSMAEGSKDNYTTQLDMKNSINKINITNYAGGSLKANYDKVLWILDNSYIPISTENYQTSTEYESLMKKAEIAIDTDSRLNLTENDIEVVQQMAIWYFTNSLDTSYNNTTLPSLYLSGEELSSKYYNETDAYGTQITGATRQTKAEKLYKYLLDNAPSSYNVQQPSLSISNTTTSIEESGDYYVFGPYTLSGTNESLIKTITANVNVNKYTLLNSSKEEVEKNDFSKVINNNFYLKIAKSNITSNTNITLSLTYTYNNKELSFMTDATDDTNTQPVVIVKSITETLNITTQIELVNINVEKVWNDSNNQDGVRPTSIKVQLYENTVAKGNPVTLNSTNWSYIWTGLLSGRTYTVKELDSSNVAIENNQKYDSNYITTYSVAENTTTITNAHIPEVTEKKVTKIWSDNNNQENRRPYSIEIKLYKTINNSKIYMGDNYSITLTSGEDNIWQNEELTYTWTNLPVKENGEAITYTVEEEALNNYIAAYSVSGNTTTITNTYTPGTTSRTVIKNWIDNENQDGNRPNDVTVQLYADGVAKGDAVVLNKENAFTYTWQNLPEKKDGELIVYSVFETKIGTESVVNDNAAGYSVIYAIQDNTTTITNTHITEKISKTVTKIWNDSDNKDNIRPISINVQLYKTVDGEKTSMGDLYKETLNQTNQWEKKWKDLPAKEDGKVITYTVEEIEVPTEYTVSYSEDTFTITNTHEIKKDFDLALRKFITVVNDTTYSREPVVDTSTIDTTGTATYKHIKQPIAVQAGDVVTYTIRVYNEGEVNGYVDKITDHLPDNLLPIIDGIEGIDSEKYKSEVEFNSKYSWVFTDKGNTVTTGITSKINTDIYATLTGLTNITDTKLNSYVEGSNTLDYIDVQIKCLVTDSATRGEYLTNIAEITDSQDVDGNTGDGKDSSLSNVDYTNLVDYKNSQALDSTENSYIAGQEDDDDFEKLIVKEFDLALRKFITKVNDTSYLNETSREPVVDTSKLGTIGTDGKAITTATYKHSKEPVIVETGDLVTYKIRVYNEGTLPGYANEITDNMPQGLEFLPDSSVNISYKWKMLDKDGNEITDLTKAVLITTDYLSDNNINNKIEAISETEGVKTLDYKEVEVQFKVTAKAEKLKENIIKNEAQISADSEFDIDSIPNRDEKYNYITNINEDDIDYEPIKLQYFDLALRKFITKVNSLDYNNRYPEIVYNEDKSITYKHTKDPVLVATGDTIIYTLRVYNEGEKSGYATEISDNLPEGLEFVKDNEINKLYNWKLVDEQGNLTEDITKAKKVTTDCLKDEIIDAFMQKDGQKILSYKDIQIAFKVTATKAANKVLVNIAEISKDSDDDVDSTPRNEVSIEDDIDKEYAKVEYFDLTLKKWVTETNVIYDGKTTTTKTGFKEDSTDIAKVDIVAKKLKKTTVKFKYSIKVTNEGEIPGYATQIKDYIPKGFEFVKEDNKNWTELKDGEVVTSELKDTLLNPGESATVEITLTWKNSSTNLGLKTNYAEISDDSGDDIDSTPDNFNLKEDDIDDAQVILSLKTAGAKTYIGLVLSSVAILAGGIFLIKKYIV